MIPAPSYQRGKDGNAKVVIDNVEHCLGVFDSDESHWRYDELIEAWEQKFRSVTYTLNHLLPKSDSGRPISRVTFSRWIRQGVSGEKLEVVRVGSRVFTTVEKVRDFLERVTNARHSQTEDVGVTDAELAEVGLS